MRKLPAKQIYLLLVIIVGIIALSVYSTYALFTFESETGDIVSIHIPKSLTISENVYEYQQIKVGPNQVVTTDIDVHNPFEYEVCYSVWYKILGDTEEQNNVQLFEHNEKSLTSSGTITPNSHLRINIIIVNDNDKEIKINLGTIGSSKQNEMCSLNLSSDKHLISISHGNISLLTTNILNSVNNKVQKEEGYLTYDIKDSYLTINKDEKLYFSNEFTYKNELFSLTEAINTTLEEYLKQTSLSEENKYFCMNNTDCSILYQIKNVELSEDKYNVTYHKLIGYLEGETGLRKINDKDYIYYGDNPDNYIYYNCKNNDDVSSCELWRIVGLFHNEENDAYNIKIVRNDSIGTYQYDYKMNNNENNSSNNWNESTLNKYLNEEYKLSGGKNYLDNYKQTLEIFPNLDMDIKKTQNELTTNSKISLLTLSDYVNASTCTNNKFNEYKEECFKNNWLNNIEVSDEWTMTVKEVEIPVVETPSTNETEDADETTNEDNHEDNEQTTNEEQQEEINKYIINYVYSVNNNIKESDVNEKLSVRPVVYLKSRMLLISGDGSFNSPYIVK